MLNGEKKTSARSKSRRYSRISCYSERKKRQRLCISKLRSNEFYSSESWRIGIERFGGTHLKFSGCTWYETQFGKENGNLEASWAKSLRARFWGITTWGNLTTSRLSQQSSVEFGEKICKLKPKTTTFYSFVKAPETQKIECLLWIRELQCTLLSKGELISDTMDTFENVKKSICDLPRPGAAQINE